MVTVVKPTFIVAAFLGMVVEAQLDPMGAENFSRYAITQGGLFCLVCVLAWSYRRDLVRMSEQKSERLTVLSDLVSRATEAQTKSADALIQSTNAIAAQAASIQSITTVLIRLEALMPSRRTGDGH